MSTAAPPPLPATYRRWSAEKHGGPGALKLVEAPLPRPGTGQLLLRVLATDATYTDLLVLSGNYLDVKTLPVTPGYECAAVVAAVGAGAAPFAVGDRVLAMPMHGCAAEFVVLPARLVVRIEDAEGAAFVAARPGVASSLALTGITAFQMLHRVMGPARIALARDGGASILVHAAAGGTGAMLVQLAKLAGIPGAQIFGTCSRKNLDAVRGGVGVVGVVGGGGVGGVGVLDLRVVHCRRAAAAPRAAAARRGQHARRGLGARRPARAAAR